MLSTQTKHINAYGKRGKRVVEVTASDAKSRPKELISIFDDLPPPPAWAPVASRMKGRENPTPKKKAPAPKAVGAQRKKRLSPPLSPVKKLIRVPEPLKESSDRVGHQSKAKVKPMPLGKSNGNTAPDSSARPPLSSHLVNVPEPPAPASLAGKMKIKQRLPSTKAMPSKLSKPASPVVKMDIIVLDDEGRTISKEQRISRSVMAKPFDRTSKAKAEKTPLRPKSQVPIYIDSESETEVVSQPKQEKLRRRATRAVVSDDLASEDGPPAPQPAPKANPNTGRGASKPLQRSATATKVLGVVESRSLKRASTVEVLIPPAPYSTKQVPRMSDLPRVTRPATPPLKARASVMPRAPAFHLPNSPVLKGRQLTPIRGGRSKGLFEPPEPPSPSTSDLDLSLDFADLSLECDEIAAFAGADPSMPTYLLPLLEECGQEECGPHDFSSFIDSFPFDPVLQKARERHGGELFFKKIGEASYSEVFGIGDVVLKVIPLRDEFSGSEGKRILKARGSIGHKDLESEAPPPTDAQDVRKEIIVTRAMGEVHHGFVKLLKTYVVKGKYPEALLSLWDEYYNDKGSESIRPDTFTLSQAYAIIVLPNGGPDMETYIFSNSLKSGWRQACSIFWQVAKSLAHAERLVSFEHRDLHWGQILIKDIPTHRAKLKSINLNSGTKARDSKYMPMDDLGHGVQVTIIDLGLSRMDAGDGSGGHRVQWTPFDEEIFLGEGDYQFDVYRMMRDLTGGDWAGYHPTTNVMWLHYLASKLLRSKGLKAPTAQRRSKAVGEASAACSDQSSFSERDCYETLIGLEQWLGQALIDACPAQAKATAPVARQRGRRATLAPTVALPIRNDRPVCAEDIVQYGAKRGWVRASRLF